MALDISMDFDLILDQTITFEDTLEIEMQVADSETNIVQYSSLSAFPAVGVITKLYIAKDTDKSYYWDAALSDYVEIVCSGDENTYPYDDTRGPTGFTEPENITVTYDKTNRTITLTGTVKALWRGTVVPSLVSGWVSDPHAAAPTQTLFLYYNGTAFVWSTTAFTYDMLQIAVVIVNGSDIFAVREVHSLGDWRWHTADHKNIGTYRDGGGVLSDYVLASTTAADRRPLISALTVRDEDLTSVITALATESYTQAYFTDSGTVSMAKAAADIVPLSGNQPYYNSFNSITGLWSQALMTTSNYMSVWLVAFPTAADSDSLPYRFQWLQGQSQGTLASQQALAPSNLSLGAYATMAPEFVFIAKVIIRYIGGNWVISEVTNLFGSRAFTTGVAAGAYLIGVSTDPSLTGQGTIGDPLKIAKFGEYTVTGSPSSQIDIDVAIPAETPFSIFIDVPAGWSTGNVSGYLRVNDIAGNIYANGGSALTNGFVINGANGWSKISVKGILISGNVQFDEFYQRATGVPAYSGSIAVGATVGQAIASITKLTLIPGTGTFPVGTRVLVTR